MELGIWTIYVVVLLWVIDFFVVYIWLKIKRKYDYKKREQYSHKEISTVYNLHENKLKIVLRSFLVGLEMHKTKQIGNIPSSYIRNILYKFVGLRLEKNVVIYGGCEFRETRKIHIGKGSVIGNDCILDGRNEIEIGENVNFSSGVSIWTEQHDSQDEYFRCDPIRYKKVVIGNRVWLSNNCIILPGVTIGEGAIIAAASVVTKDVEPFSIYAGIPARKIGERNRGLKYKFDGSHLWFI